MCYWMGDELVVGTGCVPVCPPRLINWCENNADPTWISPHTPLCGCMCVLQQLFLPPSMSASRRVFPAVCPQARRLVQEVQSRCQRKGIGKQAASRRVSVTKLEYKRLKLQILKNWPWDSHLSLACSQSTPSCSQDEIRIKVNIHNLQSQTMLWVYLHGPPCTPESDKRVYMFLCLWSDRGTCHMKKCNKNGVTLPPPHHSCNELQQKPASLSAEGSEYWKWMELR